MIFDIIDIIFEKIRNLKKSHRKNPRKLKIIFIWITLFILITIAFFSLESNRNKNITSFESNKYLFPRELIEK